MKKSKQDDVENKKGRELREGLVDALVRRKRAGLDNKEIEKIRRLHYEDIITKRAPTTSASSGLLRLNQVFGSNIVMFIDSDPFNSVVWYDEDPLTVDTTIHTIDMTDDTDP